MDTLSNHGQNKGQKVQYPQLFPSFYHIKSGSKFCFSVPIFPNSQAAGTVRKVIDVLRRQDLAEQCQAQSYRSAQPKLQKIYKTVVVDR